jgi:hypothetical protein
MKELMSKDASVGGDAIYEKEDFWVSFTAVGGKRDYSRSHSS